MKYSSVPLGELLAPIARPIRLVADDSYQSLGVKWYAKGLFKKEPVKGAQIKASRLFLVENGDFIYNRLFAWKGSFALAGSEHAGCVVSGEFPTFRINAERLSALFLMAFVSRPSLWEIIAGQSSGTAEVSRLRLNQNDFLRIAIPLPSLAEQERLVKLIAEADKLRELRDEADRQTAALVPALFHRMFGEPSSGDRWPIVPLGKLGRVITGNTPPRKTVEYFGEFVEWVKTDNIDPIRGIVTKAAEGLSEVGAARGRLLPAGAVLITCIAGSRDRLGDAAVTDRKVAINQQINAVIPHSDCNSDFLCQQVRALKRVIQHRASGNMTGIINKSTLELIPMIKPPLELQEEFAKQVTEVHSLESDQADSHCRLDDLFQSLLHRAFNGEL